jgi:hypothetical protein
MPEKSTSNKNETVYVLFNSSEQLKRTIVLKVLKVIRYVSNNGLLCKFLRTKTYFTLDPYHCHIAILLPRTYNI